MLENFRTQHITWDRANSRVYSPVTANSGDQNGRKLEVQILNGGVTEDLTGKNVSLAWRTPGGEPNGLDAFDEVDGKVGKFEIYYTTGMLSNVGKLNASIVIIDGGGRIESGAFTITVERSNVNEESAQSSNSYTALTQALVSVNNLEANYAPRLNEVTAQLEHTASSKVDKNGSMQVNYGNLSQDVREKLTGDQVGVVGVESTGQANLTQNAVSEFETSVVEKSKNLFNPNNVVRGYTLNPNTGGYIEEPTTSSTKDWIRVTPGKTLYRNFRATWSFADESFNVLGGQGAPQPAGIIEIPSNAYFIKVSSKDKQPESAQLEYGTSETPLVSGDFRFKEGIKFSGHDLDRASVPFDKLTGLVTSNNLLDPRKIVPGFYIRIYDGAFMESHNNSVFDDIAIPPGAEVLRVRDFTSGKANYILKDSAGNKVAGGAVEPTSEKTISVPTNAVSLAINFLDTELPWAMVSVGAEEKPYEPYYNYFEEILEPNANISDSRLVGKVGVAFGDSLTGMYADNYAYPSRVKDELGLEEYINFGFNGTRMSDTASEHHKSFSLVKLVDAVISNDFTAQDDRVALGTSMYETHLNNLKNTDWSKVDFVSFFYGANDYHGNVELDNESDIYDTTTFNGGLRYAIKELSTKYPHLKFIIITPSFIPIRENIKNSAGLLTDDYVRGTIAVQEELSTGLVNLFHNGQINRFNYETYLQSDGLHFNYLKGLERASELISAQLLACL